MSHIDDGKLNALLDGELDAAEAETVRTHIAACAECAKRLDEAKQFLRGAADLLGALDLPATVNVPPAPVRRVSKTAREVALDLDGATQKSPAIRPNLPEMAPPGPAARSHFDFTTLSWAAMVILAIGVGYLASEVTHVRTGSPAAEGTRAPGSASAPAAPPGAVETRASQPGPSRGGAKGSAAAHAASTPPAASLRSAPAPTSSASKRGATASEKQLARTNAPTARPPSARAAKASDLAAAPEGAARAQEVTAAPAANRLAAGAPGLNVTGVAAPRAAPAAFHRVSLEEAVARLDGVIRLMDGMRFQRVEVGPGYLVPGADRDHDVVRLVYEDSAGHRLVLDQQRVTVPAVGDVVSSDIGMRVGEVLTTATPEGSVRVRWIDGTFWLSLTAHLPPDELRRLTERVR